MDTEELTMEEKTENLMNVVVESRKRFGRMCADYEHKTALMENKILQLQIETISNYRFKSKNTAPSVDIEDMQRDIEGFAAEIIDRQRRIQILRKKVKDTQAIVLQLKHDSVGRKVHQPLTAEAMLAHAKQKQMQQDV
ncbi:hypothetical protein NE865_07510 [Phthorimaea operculella]|nr:hypothetical protein NE865_07510 [Phthorimaea operculella]